MGDTSYASRITALIEENRISTVEVADALNKTGVIEGIEIFNPENFAAGVVKYVYTYGESNWPLHEQIENIQPHTILYVDVFECGRRAVLGDIVAKYLFLYKRVKAMVVNGYVRDAHRLRKENYPIWLQGVTPLGCFNKQVPLPESVRLQAEQRRRSFDGSIMICDDSGVTMIEKEKLTEDTCRRLEFIELQEDIWFFCIDTLKWSTFETICEKRYLQERHFLPEALRERLEQFHL